MKKAIFLMLLWFTGVVYAQEFSAEKLLAEISDNACDCIEEISLTGKTKAEVIEGISECIDEQMGAYQLGLKLGEIDFGEFTSENLVEEKKNVQIDLVINTDKESREYKHYYYELEEYLFRNCEPMQLAISVNEELREFSVSDDPDALAFYQMGITAALDGDNEKAIGYYTEALKIDSVFAFAWDNIGISYRRLGDYDKAIAAYEKSLELDPYGEMPLMNIAVAYKYKGEFDKAIKAYEKLGKVHPGNPEVFYGIAHIYAFERVDYQSAADYASKAFKIYSEQMSPYRADAMDMLSIIHDEMKKQGEEEIFFQILNSNGIRTE